MKKEKKRIWDCKKNSVGREDRREEKGRERKAERERGRGKQRETDNMGRPGLQE